METLLLHIGAATFGLFAGMLLLSRVGSWIQAIAAAMKTGGWGLVTVAIISSGPWLLAGILGGGYYVLAAPHDAAWDWFFAAVAASIPIVLLIALYLQRAKRARNKNVVCP